jgi:hypothetical protein
MWKRSELAIVGLLFELVDEGLRFVARELATRLSLVEPHRPASVAEAVVTSGPEQLEQLAELPSRRGRTR